MIRCVRIWTGADGNSVFEEGRIAMHAGGHDQHGGSGDVFSEIMQTASISWRETAAGGAYTAQWTKTVTRPNVALYDEMIMARSIVLRIPTENVADALHHVQPAAIDVSSGVESAPGVKDVDKIAAFCQAARDYAP